MNTFYTNEDLIIDPHYENSMNYALYFDYDLLGRPVNWYTRVLNNPLRYVRRLVEQSSWTITCTIFLAVLMMFLILPLSDCILAIGRIFLNLFYAKWKLVAEKRAYAKRKKFRAHEDFDRYAAIYCQAAATHRGVCSINASVPRDLPDYEAVRFVFQEPWLLNKTHRALYQTGESQLWGELVEGELEDVIRLATEEKRLRKRAPLPLLDRIAARQELAKKEVPLSPQQPILSPEMKMILDWERFYKERMQASVQESYYWWLQQDKTLPVESREVTEKMKPIIIKVAEARKKKTPEMLPIDLYREMRMSNRVSLSRAHTKQRISKHSLRNNRSSSLKPDILRAPTNEARLEEPEHIVDESVFVDDIVDQDEAQATQVRATRAKSHSKRRKSQSVPAKKDSN